MATCAQCLYENAEGASSCEQCGAELVEVLSLQLGEVCRQCDSYNDPGVRICISCGHWMSSRPKPETEAESESQVETTATGDTDAGADRTPETAPSTESETTLPAPAAASDTVEGGKAAASSELVASSEPPSDMATSTAPLASGGVDKPSAKSSGPTSSSASSTASPDVTGDSPVSAKPAGIDLATPMPIAPPPTPPPGWAGARRVEGQQAVAVGSILCDRCRGENPPTARFCGSCGNPLVAAGAAPRSRAKLIVIRGTGEGHQVPLGDTPVSAGRGDTTLSFPDDPYLALLHATFHFRGKQLLVSDEGAVNGVYVRLRQAQSLRPGDMFIVGERVLRFVGVQDTPPLNPARFGAPLAPGRQLVLEEVLAGGAVGRVCRRPGPVLSLGRGGCDLNFPNDGFVSARHAELTLAGETVFLRDLGSANGTYLRIAPHGERPLAHGDYVALGRELIRVELAA